MREQIRAGTLGFGDAYQRSNNLSAHLFLQWTTELLRLSKSVFCIYTKHQPCVVTIRSSGAGPSRRDMGSPYLIFFTTNLAIFSPSCFTSIKRCAAACNQGLSRSADEQNKELECDMQTDCYPVTSSLEEQCPCDSKDIDYAIPQIFCLPPLIRSQENDKWNTLIFA